MKLWRLAQFLEELPGRLPFTRHLRIQGRAVDQFTRRDLVLYATWLLLWFLVGVVAVGRANLMAGVLYLGLGPAAYGYYVYLACTKCPYYGKRCYMGGGQCAGKLFQARTGDYTLAEDLLIPALWLGVSIYPVAVLVYYQHWSLLALYACLALGWQIFHKRNICSKCRNVRCALNPGFVGRTGRH